MTDSYNALEHCLKENGIRYEWGVPLKEYTSFKIGGNCTILLSPDSIEQVQNAIRCCRKNNINFFILGKGSNLLVSDDGFEGAVICTSNSLHEITMVGETTIACQAGVHLSKLCTFALEQGLTGLEFAYGIPGTVGGAAYMNAGAYGGEMKDVITRCDHIDGEGNPGTFLRKQLDFSYRHSAYSDQNYCITTIYFRLQKGDPEAIKARMEELMHRRVTKQPLEYPSAGSTFKRPEGAYASALIEECGLKGRSVGDAQVSEKHSGFLINRGGATCKQVLELIEQVQQEVYERTGFSLECEVKRIGF